MQGDICAEDGCTNLATTQVFEGMTRDDLVVSLVCELHKEDQFNDESIRVDK